MRKLTGIFWAAEALWVGLWIGAWEWHPETPWSDTWLRPVVVTSIAVFIVMTMNAYLLVKTADAGGNHQVEQAQEGWLGVIHKSWELFLELFAFFLAVEAAFKIADYLQVEIGTIHALEAVKNWIEVGSIIGTAGLLFHFFRSVSEARRVIIALAIFLPTYFILQKAMEAGRNIGQIELDAVQKLQESGACHQAIDDKGQLIMSCAFLMKLKEPDAHNGLGVP